MKALSIKQPWANLIASGEKTIETRKWKTEYRGRLLLCSAKEPDIEPAGCAVAVATLVDCRPMSVLDEPQARCRKYDGAFAWVFDEIQRIKPFPVRGELKVFEVAVDEGDLEEYVGGEDRL
jgi:hypothetical protein